MLPGEESDKLTTLVLKVCVCSSFVKQSNLQKGGRFGYAPAHQINWLINWISVSVRGPLHQVIPASTFMGAVVCTHAVVRNWQLVLALNE